jgi:NAD-dependent deacetylase
MRSESDELLKYPCHGDINIGDLAEDGAQLRPDIVWFEEPVLSIEEAANIVRTADVFVVIGTSLQVYPAAGLLDYVPAKVPKFLIDKAAVSLGGLIDLEVIQGPATEGVAILLEKMKFL